MNSMLEAGQKAKESTTPAIRDAAVELGVAGFAVPTSDKLVEACAAAGIAVPVATSKAPG